MSYAALIERFDRHMSRIDEELRLSREAGERHAAMYERHAAMYERHAAMLDDTREFIREMTLRLHREAETFDKRMSALDERSQRRSDATVRALADQSDAIRANTAGLLKALDRFDGK